MPDKAPGFNAFLGPIGDGSGQVKKAPGFNQVGGLPTPLEQATPSKKYAEQYIAGSNLQDYIAANQGKWGEVANAAVQTGSEAVLGTLEATSYLLDFKQHIDWIKGQEQEYTNAFAEAMKAAKEVVKETTPIYLSQESEGFAPNNFEWWANHSPSVIGTAASLLIPAAGVAKLGQVAKLGKFGQAVSATVASRLAESTMEASQVFERTLGELKNQGIPDKQAREIAGKQATNVWNTNWLFAATDFYQMKSLMKGFNTAMKGAKGSVIGEVAKQVISEAGEEAGQYISAEEGFKAATQGTDYFGKGFEQRLYDYIQEDEFKTSALLGALGGGVFSGLGPVTKATQSGVQKGVDWFKSNLTNLTAKGVAKEKANSIGDVGTSTAISNEEFNLQLFRNLDSGSLNKFKVSLEESMKDPSIGEDARPLIKNYIEDLDFLTEEEMKVKNSGIPQESYKQVLANKLEVRQLSRLQGTLKQDLEKLQQEAVKTGGLDENIVQLKKLQLTANAYTRLAKDNPKFTDKAAQLNAAFQVELNSESMKLAFVDPLKALHSTLDDSLNQKSFQLASTQEKLVEAKNDSFELNTPEGRKKKVQEAVIRKQEAEIKQQINNPATTKQQLQEVKGKTGNSELIAQADAKLAQLQQVAQEANKIEIQQELDKVSPPTEEVLPPEDEFAEAPVEPEIDVDNLEQVIDIPEEFEKELAEPPTPEQEVSFASILQKQVEAEQPTQVPAQQPTKEQKKVKTVKSEAIKKHTVTAWGKEVKTEVVEGERKIVKDQSNLAIPQTYYDSQGNEVQVTDVFATTPQGLLVSNTPEIKVGDPVVVRLVDNGKDLQAPFSLTKGFRPTGEHNFVLWVYRILPDGTIDTKPLKEIPSLDSPSDTNNKEVLAQFRKKVIQQGELRTTIADSTSYGQPRTGSTKDLSVFETDYVQDNNGTWRYGYTSYKPIIAFTGIGNKITVPNPSQSWSKEVLERVDEAVNTVDHPGNRAPGSVYILRTNQKGNLRFIQASKRKLTEQEKAWSKQNLSLLTQGRISEVNEVLYVENASIGLLSTKHGNKKPDLLSKPRTRFYVLNGPKPKIAIPLPSTNFALLDFGAFNNLLQNKDFVFEVMGSVTGTRKNVSTYNNQKEKEALQGAIDNILNNSTRNLPERHLNSTTPYTDPVTSSQHNSFYDFLVESKALTADVPGIKGIGNGQDNAYSFHLTGLYLNLPDQVEVITTQEKQPKVETITDTTVVETSKESTPGLSPQERRRQMLLKLQAGEKLRVATPVPSFKIVTQKELNWFTERFGDEALSLAKDVDKVISKGGLEAYGIYHNALVQLAQFAEEGTLYHEAMHFMTDKELGLLSENRIEKIWNEASKIYGIKRSNTKGKEVQPKLILNKNNNWVTFFVKSIIQDSAKKGYEKVLFPTGNTASKVEGHSTLEEFKKQKEDRLKELEDRLKKLENDNVQGAYDFSATSNSGKWNSANNELLSLVQDNRKAFAIYKFLIGDMQTFKEIVDFLNERGIEIPYTDRMKRADETMTVEEKQSAIDSYNNSVSEKTEDKNQIEKDVLSENNLQDETEYTPQELIDKYPLTGVQKVIWNLIKDIVNKLGIKVKFSSSRITEGFDGSNNPQNGEILIRPSTLKNGRFSEVLVHEVVHALTTKIISRVNSGVTTGLTQKQINAVKGLMKLFEAVKANNNLENKYPVKDVFEFIAHLTNEAFVKELESKDKNFLQKIADFILDILGINNANELSKKYLIDIISDGTFLEENGITVLPSDYGNNLQGSKSEEIQNIKNEVNQLKQELERVEKEGFGALRPIFKFYEETVTNVLKKNFKVNKVTDEYGNTWNEITLGEPEGREIKLRATQQEAYSNLDGDGLIEEQLAEDFRDYVLSNGKVLPKVKSAQSFFTRLWSAIKNLLGVKTEIQKLFEDISTFQSTPEQQAFFEQVRKTQLTETEEKYRLLPGFINQLEQEKAVQYVGSKVIDYMWKLSKKLGTPVEQILENPSVRSRIQGVGEENKNVSDYLFDRLRTHLNAQFTRIHNIPAAKRTDTEAVLHDNYLSMGVPFVVDNLTADDRSALGHWEDRIDELNQISGFKTEVIKRLSKDLGLNWTQTKGELKFELEDETADPDELDTEKAEDIHGIDSSLKDPARGITSTLKLFLATIEDQNNKSIFGNLPVNPAEVIRQLKGKLANNPVPFNKLAELASTDQLMKVIYDKLSKEVAEGNSTIVDEFNTRFNLTSTNYKTVRVVFRNGVWNTELIASNRASTAFVLLEKWRSGLQGPILDKEGNPHVASITALSKKIVTGVDSLKKETKEKRLAGLKAIFDSTLKTMRVELPSEVWEDVEKRTTGKKNAIDLQIRQLENWLVTEGNDTLNSFLQSLLQPNVNINRKSIFDRLAILSKDYVRENNEGAPFLGEDGNMRYGVNLPSAASDLFNEIKSDPQAKANYYLQDKFYANNKVVTDVILNAKNLAAFERNEILAYRQGDNDAKDFGQRTTQESAVTRLTAFVNNDAKDFGYYYFGTHEAKQKQTVYQLPKKGSGEALPFLKDTLRGVIQAEKIRIQRIKQFPDSVLGQIDQLSNATRFIYIPELNSIQGLTESITNGDLSIEEIKKLGVQVDLAIDKFIEDQYKGFENYLAQLGLVEKKGESLVNKELPEGLLTSEAKSLPVDVFLRNFFYNDFAWRHELARLFNGDIAQYKSTEDYFKRNYQTVTPGTKPYNDPQNPTTFRTAIHKYMGVTSPLYGQIKDAQDSQTWIMPSAYKAIAESLGTWTSDHELVYDLAWKDHMTVSQAIRQKGLNQQDAEIYRDALKRATTPPLKPFQFSDLVITLPNGEKMIIKEQIKDSRATLNPEFALRNKNFKQLYLWMVDNKIDVLASESGVKLGKFGMLDTNQPALPSQIRTHNLSDIRLPQLNSDNTKVEVSGSQKHKLILGDIIKRAKYGKITGEELIQEHQELWSRLHERDSKDLKKKLGFDTSFKLAQTTRERFKQLKTIKDKLERALSTKEASENLYDTLTIIKDKLNNLNFVASLALPQNAFTFESSLINLFKKIFLNPKTPGFMGVNMADFVSGVSTDSNLNFIKKEGDTVTEAEIGMPVSFFNKIGLNFTEEFVERATNKIKWDKLNDNQKKALQGVLYRIPTSNKSSMLPVRIVQVIQGAGNVVMFPPEVLTQQGPDFDFDKSQVALRLLKNDGTVDEEAIENKIFDLEWEILTSPHHYEEMLRPLTSNHLEALAEPYKQQASALSPMNTARDLMAEEQNKDAKTMIGIYSRGNTAHAVLQILSPYIQVNPGFGFPVKAKTEFVTLGKFKDNAGRMISENFAEYQAGALDAGNKPILYYIGASTVTSPVVVKLLLQGVTPSIITNFLKQPIVTEWLAAYQQEQAIHGATEQVMDKYKGLSTKLNQLKDQQISVELTEHNLASRLTAPIESSLDYSAKVLQVFLDELQKSNVVRNITDVMSIDTFGDMSSTASVKAMLNKARIFMTEESPVRIDPRVFDYKNAPREAKRIASFFKHALLDSLEFSGQFFPYDTPAYNDSLAAVERGVGSSLNKNTIKSFQQFMNFHTTELHNLVLPTLDKLAPNPTERWKFTQADKSMWSRIQQLLEATNNTGRPTHPEITTNFFVQSIRKGYSQKGDVQMVGVNNNVGNVDRNLLIKSWRDLMLASDPVAKQLAYDLVRFSIYTSGFGFTINSFANLIPLDFFIENGITEGHYDMLSTLATTPINSEGAARSFIRHNFPLIPEVPRLSAKTKPVWNDITGQVTGYNLIATSLVKPNFIKETGELLSFTIPTDSKLRTQQKISKFVKISTSTIMNGRRVNNWSLYEANPLNQAEFRKVQSLGRNYWETTEDGLNKSKVPVNQTYPYPNPWEVKEKKQESKQPTEEGSDQIPSCSK